MKITESQLRQIITEEMDQLMAEAVDWDETGMTLRNPDFAYADRPYARAAVSGAEEGREFAEPFAHALNIPAIETAGQRIGAVGGMAGQAGRDIAASPYTDPGLYARSASKLGHRAYQGAKTGFGVAGPVGVIPGAAIGLGRGLTRDIQSIRGQQQPTDRPIQGTGRGTGGGGGRGTGPGLNPWDHPRIQPGPGHELIDTSPNYGESLPDDPYGESPTWPPDPKAGFKPKYGPS
jgi:hypothetical protein